MKSLTTLMQCVLIDLGARCGTSTTRDFKTVTSRVEHEGLSFLTITLSTFGSDFQKSLDQGYVAHDQFSGFSRAGGLPRFMGGFLELVFDRSTGRLLDVPLIEAIRAIRQITLLFSKMDVECSRKRVTQAFDQYIECENDLRKSDSRLSAELNRLADFQRIGRILWASLFSAVDTSIYNDSVTPRHGPGSTADKLRGNAKYNQRLWTQRLENVFPHWEHVIPSESFLQRTDCFRIVEPGDEIPVKVIAVPKTLKSPRIIATEPTCMQYMQQGVLSVMMKQIPRFNHSRNFVMFESQEPNQRLAREGSITGTLATLDLSEASDRVSNQHVRLLVANHRILREAVDATRSRKADVPGYGEIRLAKYASMGSALCFPFEAMVFTTIIFVGIQRALNRQLTEKDLVSFYGRVRVYGDDIIIPVEFVQSVIEELEAFGLRVNHKKSFWTGRFRESCGKDYYAGHDVSVVKCRRPLPKHRKHVHELVSASSLRNLLEEGYFPETVDYLDQLIGKIIPYPYIQAGTALLGRHVAVPPCQEFSHDRDLHRPLVRAAWISSKSPSSPLGDYGALLKFFIARGEEPMEDEEHLARAGRANSARIKVGMASPYSYGLGVG